MTWKSGSLHNNAVCLFAKKRLGLSSYRDRWRACRFIWHAQWLADWPWVWLLSWVSLRSLSIPCSSVTAQFSHVYRRLQLNSRLKAALHVQTSPTSQFHATFVLGWLHSAPLNTTFHRRVRKRVPRTNVVVGVVVIRFSMYYNFFISQPIVVKLRLQTILSIFAPCRIFRLS